MTRPLFSVIIPTYNRAELLAATLASVFAQRFTSFEVLVVDDGSTDHTAQVLAAYGQRLRVLTQSNGGPGAARNLACEQACGQYVAFLDSDDLWFPWTLDVYAQAIRQAGEPSFLSGRPAHFQTSAELAQVAEQPLAVQQFSDYLASGEEWLWYGASSLVVRTDVVKAVGAFTDRWINGEDADLTMRLGTSNGFVHVSSPAMFGYRQHQGSAVSNDLRTLEGAWHMTRMEQRGQYPGGAERAEQRWRIETRHLRPVAIRCLQLGWWSEAWGLYRATFPWHYRLGRWRFLSAFPFMFLAAWLRSPRQGVAS